MRKVELEFKMPSSSRNVNEYQLGVWNKSQLNALEAAKISNSILDKMTKILKEVDYDLKLSEYVLSPTNDTTYSNGCEINSFQIRMVLEDGVGEIKKIEYPGRLDIVIEKYTEKYFPKKYDEIMSMVTSYPEVGEVISEQWEMGTYLSFNIYIEQVVDKKDNIEVYYNPNSHGETLTIGEEYWIGQTMNRHEFESCKQYKLLEIEREGYQTIKFHFEGIDKSASPYSMVAKGNVGVSKSNINRIEDHIIIKKHKDLFINDMLGLFRQDYIMHGNNEDMRIRFKKLMTSITELI